MNLIVTIEITDADLDLAHYPGCDTVEEAIQFIGDQIEGGEVTLEEALDGMGSESFWSLNQIQKLEDL